MKKYQTVQRKDGSWIVIRADSKRASSVHNTQEEAEKAAHELTTRNGGELEVNETATIPYKTSRAGRKSGSSDKAQMLAQRVGKRIERARLMRGYSLRVLAEKLEGRYSHTTLQKYEKGEINADTELLVALARVLDIRPDYFMKSDELKLEMVEYRKLSKLAKKDQKKIEEEAFEFFERYLEIEQILAVNNKPLPKYNLQDKSGEELDEAIEDAALDLRKKWQLGLNPIPNVHTMLESQGIKVKLLESRQGFDGFSALARAGKSEVPVIALAKEPQKNIARQRFTLVHELAHLILMFPEYLTAREKENKCHRFAGAFLIPQIIFKKLFGENRLKIAVAELKAIKAEWGISCAAIMKRAHDLILITDGRYKSFNIMANKWNWRENEPGHWAGEEASSRFSQMVFRALAEGIISISKACGLLNLSNAELAEQFELVG